MSAVIETKVSLPAVVVACGSALAAALYTVARAYGFTPSDEQNTALLGLGAAIQYVAYVLVGYFAPHTPRPDVAHPLHGDRGDRGALTVEGLLIALVVLVMLALFVSL